MTDIVAAAPEKPRGKKGLLIPLVATLVLGGAGFASSYLGFWSPSGMLSGPEEPVQSTEHMSVEFIDIPTIEIVIPGGAPAAWSCPRRSRPTPPTRPR